jgi:hypothetical protein
MTSANISGTTNYLPKFTSANVLGNSIVTDNGSNVGILGSLNVTSSATTGFIRIGGGNGVGESRVFIEANGNLSYIDSYGDNGYKPLQINASQIGMNAGNLIVGGTSTTFKFEAVGIVAFGGVGNVIYTKPNTTTYSRFLNSSGNANVVYTGNSTANSGAFGINNFEDTVRLFNILNSGDATFASKLTVNGTTTLGTDSSNGDLTIISNSTPLVIRGRASYNRPFMALSWDISPDAGVMIGNVLKFNTNATIGTNVGSTALTLTTTGTASFLSSVDLVANFNSSTNKPYLRLDESGSAKFFIGQRTAISGDSGTGYDIYSVAGNDIRFYTNGSATPALSLATNRSATFSSSINRMMIFNSSSVSGPYVTWQTSGNDEFYIGKSTSIAGGSGYYDIYSNAAGGGLRFYTNGNGSSALMLASSNIASFSYRVGINQTSPACYLDINLGGGGSNGTPAIKIAGTGNYDSFEMGIFGSYDAMIRTYGNDIRYYSGHWRTIGSIATENHSHFWFTSKVGSADWSTAKMILDHNANLTVINGVYAVAFFESSDFRLKKLIEHNPIIEGIENLQAKLYEKNGKLELGYFAQDAEKIMPYAVTKGTDGFLSLSYREVHTAKIARLEKEVAELKAKLNAA